MKLSVPVYRLKHRARELARQRQLPLHRALDLVAQQQGFARWSLLVARHASLTPDSNLLALLEPGERVLLAARPRQGKTLLGMRLVAQALQVGADGAVFTLENNADEVTARLQRFGADPSLIGQRCAVDTSDKISADYMIDRLQSASAETVVAIDYLQLLDQNRRNPPLMAQVRKLAAFARQRKLIMLFISQIDRSYEKSGRALPDLRDVRLPNPLDLSLFNRLCFLNNGRVNLM